MTAPYIPPRPRTLEEALRAAFMPPIQADATATPPVRPDFSGVPMATMRSTSAPMPRGPRESGNPAADRLNARVDRGLAMLGRQAAPSADTPEGWLREMFNPVAAGRGTREMANATGAQMRRAGRTGNVSDAAMAAGLGAVTAASVVPGGSMDDAARVGASRVTRRGANVNPAMRALDVNRLREIGERVQDIAREAAENGRPVTAARDQGTKASRSFDAMHDYSFSDWIADNHRALPDSYSAMVKAYLKDAGIGGQAGKDFRVAAVAALESEQARILNATMQSPTPEASAIRNALVPQAPDAKMIDVDGVMRPRFNARGQLIHPTEDGIRNFWRWFEDSRTVDDAGRPQVVYHGTGRSAETPADLDFTEFRQNEMDKGYGWFASNKKHAEVYNEGRMIDAYLQFKNPVVLPNAQGRTVNGWLSALRKSGVDTSKMFARPWDGFGDGNKFAFWELVENNYGRNNILDELKRQGFDGLVTPTEQGISGRNYLSLSPEKIKGVENSGAFSPATKNIAAGVAAALGLGNASRQQERP